MKWLTILVAAAAFSLPVTASAGETVSRPLNAPATSIGGHPVCIHADDSQQADDCQKALPTGDLVGTSDAQTLTGKGISGTANSLSNIPNAALQNPQITVAGHSVQLGGSTLLNCADLADSGSACPKSVGTTAGTVAAGDDSRIAGAAQKANNGNDFASAGGTRANLNSVHSVVTSNTSLDATARLWPCDASGGAVTLTVPAGSGVPNYIWDVKKVDSSANTCTLAMTGSDALDGNASTPIRFQNDDLTIQNRSGSSTWYIR